MSIPRSYQSAVMMTMICAIVICGGISSRDYRLTCCGHSHRRSASA